MRRQQRIRAAAGLAVAGGYIAVASVVGLSLASSGAARRGIAARAAARRSASRLRHTAPVGSSASDARSAVTSREIAADDPFPPDPADRAPRPDETVSMYADGLACSVGCRPYGALDGWPLAPFHVPHPLRAGLNELRSASLHVAVDIQAPDGAQVYAVQPGYARILERLGPNARVQVGNYIYWHINPLVEAGQLVVPFKTVLGRVMNGYGHIAFSELGPLGDYVNPLRPTGSVLRPFIDRARPVIGAPALAADGQVVIAVYDPQTVVHRTTYITPVLAPAALAYRLYDRLGAPVTPLEWAFRGTHLLPYAARQLIYAPDAHAPGYGCFASRSVCVPNWTYRAAGGLAPPLPRWLPAGEYRLSIYAWDWADNETARDSNVTLTADGWQALGRFPSARLTAPGWTPYGYEGTPDRPSSSTTGYSRR